MVVNGYKGKSSLLGEVQTQQTGATPCRRHSGPLEIHFGAGVVALRGAWSMWLDPVIFRQRN